MEKHSNQINTHYVETKKRADDSQIVRAKEKPQVEPKPEPCDTNHKISQLQTIVNSMKRNEYIKVSYK